MTDESKRLSDEEIAAIRECMPYIKEVVEVAKDRQAMTRVQKKIGKYVLGLAAFIGAVAVILSNAQEWLKKWLVG